MVIPSGPFSNSSKCCAYVSNILLLSVINSPFVFSHMWDLAWKPFFSCFTFRYIPLTSLSFTNSSISIIFYFSQTRFFILQILLAILLASLYSCRVLLVSLCSIFSRALFLCSMSSLHSASYHPVLFTIGLNPIVSSVTHLTICFIFSHCWFIVTLLVASLLYNSS